MNKDGRNLMTDSRNVKSDAMNDIPLRVAVGTDDALADLRVNLLFHGYTPLPASDKGVYLTNWSNLDEDGVQRYPACDQGYRQLERRIPALAEHECAVWRDRRH